MSSKIIERRYHDLSFVIRPLPMVKVASNTRACSKIGGTTSNEGVGWGKCSVSQLCD